MNQIIAINNIIKNIIIIITAIIIPGYVNVFY